MVHRRLTLAAKVLALSVALLLAVSCAGGATAPSTPTKSPEAAKAPEKEGAKSPQTEASKAASSKEPIKIGMLVEQTGQFSWYGQENLNGAQLYVEELNAKGGINGRPIELIIYNSESLPEKAVSGAQKLIQQDKVVAIVGLGLVSEATAVAAVVKEGPPTYSLSGAYTPGHRMMFGGTVLVDDMQRRSLQFLADRKMKRIGVLTTNDTTGQLAQKVITEAAPKYGAEITRLEVFNPADVDVTAQLNQIKATNPDAIIGWALGKPLGVVLKGAKQLGITVPIITSHGNLSPGFIESIAEVQPGPLYMFGTKDLIWRDVPDSDPQKAVITAMQTKHQAKYGKEGGIGTGTGYDSLMILSEAIKKSGSTEPMKIVEAIEGIKNLVGVVGTYNFSQQDHRGLDSAAAIPMEITKGQLKAVK